MVRLVLSRVVLSAAGALGAHLVYLLFKPSSRYVQFEEVNFGEKTSHAIEMHEASDELWSRPWKQ